MGNQYSDLAGENHELHQTLRSINAQLYHLSHQMQLLNNKVDNLEEKICEILPNLEEETEQYDREDEFYTQFVTYSCLESINTKNRLYPTQVLELIGKYIHIKERKEYTNHYEAFIRYIIQKLKTDEIFKKIFKGEVMSGSYRDKLKISKPNEFDTILRLDLGINKNSVVKKIANEGSPYCTIQLRGYDLNNKPYLKTFLDSEGYILQDNILVWLQNRLRHKLLENDLTKTIHTNDHTYQYQGWSLNGPAFTYKVKVLNTDIKFDIDLVPAILLDETHWVSPRHYSNELNKVGWILVPKPPKSGIQRNNRSFKCSYTEMEVRILHDIPNVKNLIRIFKKFRDTQELTDLKSYYIKTMFLWQLDSTTIKERKVFWTRSLELLFLEMFNIIYGYIKRGKLPFYWDNSYNMFTEVGESKLQSWENKLRGIKSKLEKNLTDNPRYLIDIILPADEKCYFKWEHAL